RTYICEYCNKGFPLKRTLHKHLKRTCYWNPKSKCYHKQKPFSCSKCDASYTKQNDLMWHMRHDCGRIFMCDHCDKIFLHSNNLKRHRK
ncbi:Zinc finger protein 333, partial [Camponotus floridanus]